MGLSRRTLATLGLSVLLVIAFGWLVGVESLLSVLAGARPGLVGVALAGALAATVCWSEAFRSLLLVEGVEASHWEFFVLYNASVFPKNVLPAGHATGPVVVSLLLSRRLDREYTPTLALMSLGEVVNLLTSLSLALVGIAGVALFVPSSPVQQTVTLSLFALLVVLGAVSALVWRRQDLLRRSLAGLAFLGRATVGRVSARASSWLARDRIVTGADRFVETLSGAGDQRSTMLAVSLLSIAGWLGFVVSLLASMASVGHPVPVAVAAFLVPASGLVGVLPMPGGLGGVEVAMAAALVSLAGVPLAAALAGTLVYRLCTYWALTGISGLAAATVSVDVVGEQI